MRSLFWRWLFGLLDKAEFALVSSDVPRGKRLGGHDIPDVRDKFLILTIGLQGLVSFTGYFQTA